MRQPHHRLADSGLLAKQSVGSIPEPFCALQMPRAALVQCSIDAETQPQRAVVMGVQQPVDAVRDSP
jgi:hypothetical protein